MKKLIVSILVAAIVIAFLVHASRTINVIAACVSIAYLLAPIRTFYMIRGALRIRRVVRKMPELEYLCRSQIHFSQMSKHQKWIALHIAGISS
jgi:hypothetical protein